MTTSNTVTKTDLENIINAIFPATTEDMTQAQIDAFVASLNTSGTSVLDLLKQHIKQKSVTASSATSINANTTTWITLSVPSGDFILGVCGYYLNGGITCNVYNITNSSTAISFALRNYGSSAQSVTITAYYLVIE